MESELVSIRPFEICSTRPPTENYSLSFRLTRNCYWNKCAFCPVYKAGARYSKRSIDEVKADIRRARLIDDLMFNHGIGNFQYTDADYARVDEIVDTIERARREAGIVDDVPDDAGPVDLDPSFAWFLPWFKDTPNLADSFNHVLSWRIGGARTCFLGDADSLILSPAFLHEAIHEIKMNFPTIERFTVYGRTGSAARLRTLKELRAYREAGLSRVHFGLESGSDAVLQVMNKGVTRDDHIEGALKTKEAGLSCSVYVMPGLGGVRYSDEHAHETADVLTRIAPDYIRLRTLQIFPQTPLQQAQQSGEFIEAHEEQVVREIRTLVEKIEADTELLSDSASNLLNIQGSLPTDRALMLAEIDRYLNLSRREKLLYSARARLQSFVGQYGGLSREIYDALSGYIREGRVNLASAHDSELEEIITLVRSRLMP
ncbi:MAG TPA: radical SAM protein [Deltaproteobacteria bacterium]|nr:radical SAM protein [Deltaproteobacteria bacterium]